MAVTAQQQAIIADQLGREPRGIVRIAAQSSSGVPLVLQMRSLVNDQPFPTLYWLSSKTLGKAIGQIETAGWVKELEQRIEQEPALREQLLADQRRYIDQRWQLMHADDKTRIEALGFTELFHSYGIGGITQWDKVRCLHMHYAHHLADGNVIGRLMDQQFQLHELAVEN